MITFVRNNKSASIRVHFYIWSSNELHENIGNISFDFGRTGINSSHNHFLKQVTTCIQSFDIGNCSIVSRFSEF
jgi:hypothetical protein